MKKNKVSLFCKTFCGLKGQFLNHLLERFKKIHELKVFDLLIYSKAG